MKSNEDLQKDVQNAIKWEPLLNAAEIGVTVKDGVVTLTGIVDSFSKKSEAEDAAKNVSGVTAVVEKIAIKFSSDGSNKDDNEIAVEAVNALKRNWQVPNEKVKAKIEKGWVTLEGEVHWNFERVAAMDAVKYLWGVAGVSNNITIRSETEDAIERKDIEGALDRNWALNADDINVHVAGTNVTLSGTVGSWYQKDEAGRIAWNAPGVWAVDNQLFIEYN